MTNSKKASKDIKNIKIESVEAFLKRGGKIEIVPMGKRSKKSTEKQ